MTVAVFASGSTGNCALVSWKDTHILVDAGISLRRIRAALARRRLRPEDLAGVLVTHQHSDHVRGLEMLLKYHPMPVWAPPSAAGTLARTLPGAAGFLRPLEPGRPFPLKDVTVTPFSTMHDTGDSVGYLFRGDVRLGFCTDTGCVTGEMLRYLSGCDGAVLEANHDVGMLRRGPYPPALQNRILSDRGHLSNEQCGKLACRLAGEGARYIILGHLSRENNRPALALETVGAALDGAGFSHVKLCAAPEADDLVLEILPCWESGSCASAG